MNQIADFVQVRADGKLVPSTLTIKEMLARGWQPSKVVALKWNGGGREVEVQAPSGIHGIVVPGANFVAALYGGDEINPRGRLIILSSDGSMHGEIDNFVSISGKGFCGTFGWFEPAMAPHVDMFGVVFQTDEQVALRCDVDASTSSFVKVIKVQ